MGLLGSITITGPVTQGKITSICTTNLEITVTWNDW